jgi:hypothetical protein
MDIGVEQPPYVVEPLEDPVPREEPEERPLEQPAEPERPELPAR